MKVSVSYSPAIKRLLPLSCFFHTVGQSFLSDSDGTDWTLLVQIENQILWSPLSYIRSKYPNPKSVLELVGAGIAAYCGDLGSKGIARQGFRAFRFVGDPSLELLRFAFLTRQFSSISFHNLFLEFLWESLKASDPMQSDISKASSLLA